MSDTKSEEQAVAANAKPEGETAEIKSPTKRTPKRKADAFQKESEELLKTLGVTVDMEDGRRRTRSSARGGGPATPTATPATPPAKRARGGAQTPTSKRGKPTEEVVPGEESHNTDKGTPKKRTHVEPKKLDLTDKNEASSKDDKDQPEVDGTETSTAVAKDADSEKEVTKDKEAESVKDEADSTKDAAEVKQQEPAKTEDAQKETTTVTGEKNDSGVEEIKSDSSKTPDTPMEVDVQEDKPPAVVADEAKPTNDVKPTDEEKTAVQESEQLPPSVDETGSSAKEENVGKSAESNGTPEVKDVTSETETEVVQATDVLKESAPTQEAEKTPSSVSVNDVVSAAQNNANEKDSPTVESKIVTNDTAAVEPATAAP
ncbi:uncharacterized protein LOC131284958 [Anopheles ziemanni]|uniref:uncharacterized protein LOC131260968 n=1 Tax=Anopheles coustani TaxID=139045 RepID=UPI00265A2865|nr:uncharacterized protein LOC131260968 [Anopheles coustani]XP_058169799.1 uncharacterized protein LOC131284958 [Anopheles ziemanni]